MISEDSLVYLLGIVGSEAGEDVLSHVLGSLVGVADPAGQLWEGHQPNVQGQVFDQPLHGGLDITLSYPLLSEHKLK